MTAGTSLLSITNTREIGACNNNASNTVCKKRAGRLKGKKTPKQKHKRDKAVFFNEPIFNYRSVSRRWPQGLPLTVHDVDRGAVFLAPDGTSLTNVPACTGGEATCVTVPSSPHRLLIALPLLA